MSNAIKPEKLAEALQENLELYHQDVIDRVNAVGYEAAEKLKRLTRATAPKQSGFFRKHIDIAERTLTSGLKTFYWYAKPPSHRVVHLLVHGHATKGGGRTKGIAVGSLVGQDQKTVMPAQPLGAFKLRHHHA